MKPALPPSETHLPTNTLGYFTGLAAVFLLKDSGLPIFDMVVIVLAAACAPILLIEHFIFKRYKEPRAGLDQKCPCSWKRVAIKYVGLLAVLAVFTALYSLLPEYKKAIYTKIWPFYVTLAPFVLLTAPLYFAWCDKRQNDPEDAYWHLGSLVLFRFKGIDRMAIARLFRNWLVKAFFLPLMFAYLSDSVGSLQNVSFENMSFLHLYFVIQAILMFGDLIYATLGYVLTLRIFNSQIRSSEPTFLGWFVALACYYPFWHSLVFLNYLNYEDSIEWYNVIPEGIFQYIWAGLILGFIGIYILCTICLGVRFSNLTYRGLVTNGPYRYTKHPGYVAKNISWWLMSMPFISNMGVMHAISASLMLFGVNCIYYLRARTEENHLSNYPEYVEYAEAMNERSIFVPLARHLTFLKYKNTPSKI